MDSDLSTVGLRKEGRDVATIAFGRANHYGGSDPSKA